MALLTVALFGVALAEWGNNRASARHTQVVERAYVALSHAHPGLTTDGFVLTASGQQAIQKFQVRMGLKNHGSTPADVLAVHLAYYFAESLPEVPPYRTDTGTEAGAFLMPAESLEFGRSYSFPVERLELVRAKKQSLWLIGYVDYRDRFGTAHRGGYARCWDPFVREGEANLVIVTKRGYNYDT